MAEAPNSEYVGFPPGVSVEKTAPEVPRFNPGAMNRAINESIAAFQDPNLAGRQAPYVQEKPRGVEVSTSNVDHMITVPDSVLSKPDETELLRRVEGAAERIASVPEVTE